MQQHFVPLFAQIPNFYALGGFVRQIFVWQKMSILMERFVQAIAQLCARTLKLNVLVKMVITMDAQMMILAEPGQQILMENLVRMIQLLMDAQLLAYRQNIYVKGKKNIWNVYQRTCVLNRQRVLTM
jgi:hypothetical protein